MPTRKKGVPRMWDSLPVKWLEELSDLNIVHFYKQSLLRLHQTGRCSLSSSERLKLKRLGLLSKDNSHTQYILTDKALKLLEVKQP